MIRTHAAILNYRGRAHKPYEQEAPCAWAWYYAKGDFSSHELNDPVRFLASKLVLEGNEPPVLFYHLKGSWFPDWNFADNNFLRSLLATPNYGMACLPWDDPNAQAWNTAPLALGAPLADTMRNTVGLRPFQSILGDPTLRMNPPMPVSNLSASLEGSTVTLNWDPGFADDTIYYVVRSDNGLDGFGVPFAGITGTTFVDENAAVGTMYQVRACHLVRTGSGSYWDLSQGAFVTLE